MRQVFAFLVSTILVAGSIGCRTMEQNNSDVKYGFYQVSSN